jgi:nucleoside 2-deoxyribosyltransferase
MDVGTAWEMGYGYARGMPIAGYCSDTSTYKERFTALNMNDLHEVEDFGLIDNLMLTVPVRIFQSMQDAVQYLGKVLA